MKIAFIVKRRSFLRSGVSSFMFQVFGLMAGKCGCLLKREASFVKREAQWRRNCLVKPRMMPPILTFPHRGGKESTHSSVP
jgi:hypothetical protein